MSKEEAMEIESDGESDIDLEWLLGFSESPRAPRDLLRHAFPSKIGGRPAWLDPVHLPTREQLTCQATGRLLRFLLQVYAPIDENPNAFHRAIYLFISPRGDKLTQPSAVKALRCQLPRDNRYYPSQPVSPLPDKPQPLAAAQLEESTSKDPWQSEVHTTSQNITTLLQQEQQQQDEQSNGDNNDTNSNSGNKQQQDIIDSLNSITLTTSFKEAPELFPECELVVEPEESEEEESIDTLKDSAVQAVLQQYNARNAEEGGEYTEEELPGEVIDTLEKGTSEEQQHFAAFAARIAKDPEQCLRYCFDPEAVPLCPSPAGIPSSSTSSADIPCCARCGGPRQFEFQVMPQLLHILGVDASDAQAPDWGAIAVYSCAGSCDIDSGEESGYVEEYVWVQPPI